MKETQIEVVDPRYRVPRIKIPTVTSVEKMGRLFTVHQACKTGEFGGEIAAMVAEEGFCELVNSIRRLGAYDLPVPLDPVREGFVIPKRKGSSKKYWP